MAFRSQTFVNSDDMASQFDVYRTAEKSVVVVIQNDLLDDMRVRVVVPLFRYADYGSGAGSLNPELIVNGTTYVLMTEYAASLTLPELGELIGSVAEDRDKIIRAVDTLLAGV